MSKSSCTTTASKAKTFGKKSVASFFLEKKTINKTQHMNVTKFGLLIYLRSMEDSAMHCSGTRLVNTKDRVQVELERTAKGSGNVNCHVFMHIMDKQLDSVQF